MRKKIAQVSQLFRFLAFRYGRHTNLNGRLRHQPLSCPHSEWLQSSATFESFSPTKFTFIYLLPKSFSTFPSISSNFANIEGINANGPVCCSAPSSRYWSGLIVGIVGIASEPSELSQRWQKAKVVVSVCQRRMGHRPVSSMSCSGRGASLDRIQTPIPNLCGTISRCRSE